MRNYSDKYLGLKRMAAFVASIGLWGVSMYFSYEGFKFESTAVLWFGVVLALVVTVVELVFNTRISKLNPTLLAAGVICYVYGTYTNISGFYVLQHGTTDGFWTGSGWIIPIVAGLICEALPEALFAWSVGAFDDGDLVGNVAEMFSGAKNDNNSRDQRDSGKSGNKNRFSHLFEQSSEVESQTKPVFGKYSPHSGKNKHIRR